MLWGFQKTLLIDLKLKCPLLCISIMWWFQNVKSNMILEKWFYKSDLKALKHDSYLQANNITIYSLILYEALRNYKLCITQLLHILRVRNVSILKTKWQWLAKKRAGQKQSPWNIVSKYGRSRREHWKFTISMVGPIIICRANHGLRHDFFLNKIRKCLKRKEIIKIKKNKTKQNKTKQKQKNPGWPSWEQIQVNELKLKLIIIIIIVCILYK